MPRERVCMESSATFEDMSGIEEVLSQVIGTDRAKVGLTLVPGATGLGKTRAAVRQMARNLIENGRDCRRYIFVTNVKRNLPVKDLLSELKAQGHPELCDLVLYLDSNIDMLINNLDTAESLMPDTPYSYLKRGPKQPNKKYVATRTEFSIAELPEFLEVKRRISQLKDAKAISTRMAKVRQLAIDNASELLQDAECKLRYTISKEIGSVCKPDDDNGYRLLTTREKRELVEHEEWWAWLTALYPSVLTYKKRVIFMSLDKLLVKNSPIIEPSESIWDSELLDGSVLFIDEFELSKRIVNEHLINESVEQMTDVVNLYHLLFDPIFSKQNVNEDQHGSSCKTFSGDLFRSPAEHAGYGHKLRAMLEPIIEAGKEVASELHLDMQFRLSEDLRHRQQPFLFNDFQSRVISSGSHQWASIHFLEARNEIVLGSGIPPHNDPNNAHAEHGYYSVPLLLERLGGIDRWFIRWIALAAENYQQVVGEDAAKGRRAEVSFDSAVGTVLSELNIMGDIHGQDNPERRRIIAMAYEERSNGRNSHEDAKETAASTNLSLHQTGFRIHSFVESPQHDTLTRMERCTLPCTAESKLIELSQRNLVLGISASLDIPTVLGNYDMDYIKGALGDLFIPLSSQQRSLIEEDYRKSICHYDKVDIRAYPIADTDTRGDYSEQVWQKVFDDPVLARRAFDKVSISFVSPQDRNGSAFSQRRVLRICIAYRKFWEAGDARAMLCILNKLPKPGDATLDLIELKELFASILAHLKIEVSVEDTVRVLGGSSEEFELAKDETLASLAAGRKLFVMTAYQSAGAGQNLQYKIPAGLHPVKINDRPSSDEMDFDCLYLETPTHTSPVIGQKTVMSEKEVLAHTLSCEYLYENAEITRGQLIGSIQEALLALGGAGTDYGYKDSESSRLYAAQRIYQAVGRLGRTNMKAPTIRLYAQDNLLEGVPIDILRSHGLIFTPEFNALVDCLVPPIPQLSNGAKRLERKAALACDRSRACISSILGSGWHARARQVWHELGAQVLRYPTLPDGWDGPSYMERNYYVELPEASSSYRYTSEGDFRIVTVLLGEQPNKRSFQVSEAASRLELLMRIPGMREHFEKLGYATHWVPSTKIMTPIVAESIYKGRLGETCGRFILEESGIAVEEIEDAAKFEKFDFALSDNTEGSVTYIDFKHWKKPSDKTGWDSEQLVDWVFSKMVAVSAQRAIIANILPPDDENHQITMRRMDELRLLCVPSLVLGDCSINPQAIQAIRSFIHGDSD